MKIKFKILTVVMILFSFSSFAASIKNAKTEQVKIYGNCEMCKKTIETVGNVKKLVKVDWNKDTKIASITYDATKTNQDEILKRIALAGYDSDKFLAPDDVYNKLPDCCQYERVNKSVTASTSISENHQLHVQGHVMVKEQETNQLRPVFESYFTLKDALVKSDSKLAATSAEDLLKQINAVKMGQLSSEEHTVWMKVLNNLKANTNKISSTTNLKKQRMAFIDLSGNLYDLSKVSKQDYTMYYQHCPMFNDGKGANWLSKENAVKNPYYGSQMMTCGKTIETIK